MPALLEIFFGIPDISHGSLAMLQYVDDTIFMFQYEL
jgi:hypothetical protein